MNPTTQKVDFEVLRNHAHHLDGLNDNEVADAIDAAQQTDVSNGAFGVLCSGLVPAQQSATDACSDAINKLSTMLTDTGDAVRAWADLAEAAEDSVIDQITQLANEWKGL